MRVAFLSILVFLFLLILNADVSAQQGTGGTTINATVSGVWELNLSLQYPEIVIPEDYYFYENLTVFQIDSQDISVYMNKTDTNNFVKFVNKTDGGTYYQDDYTLQLPVSTYENVTLRVYVPPDQGFDGGTYNIQIYAYSLSDSRSNSTTLKIHVNNTNPIDDIEILNIYPSSLYSGQSFNVDISIHKIYPSETTDIQICYCIDESPGYPCDPDLNNYGCSWKAVTEWLNYTKTVTVNENPGTYYFIIAVKYPNYEDIKRANSPKFYVRSPTPVTPGPGPPSVPSVPAEPELAIIATSYIEASPGERIRFDIEVQNTGDADALNTTLSLYGVPEDWISITPLIQDIGIGESKNYSVSIAFPDDAFEQVYSIFSVAKSGDIEEIKIITLTVAMTLEKTAKFLIDEARAKKEEAEEIIGKVKDLGMDTAGPEKTLTTTNDVLDEAQGSFESGDYKRSIEKAKEAIEGYKSVITSTEEIVEEAYFSLLNEVRAELTKIENLTEERDVIESVKEKINQSMTLQREKRIIGAYITLLEAKQLLDQLESKIYFRELARNTAIVSIVIIIIVVVSMFLFYRKKMSKFLKIMRLEEHKKRLRYLFRKEEKPRIPPYEERLRERQRITKEMTSDDWEKLKERLRRKKRELSEY